MISNLIPSHSPISAVNWPGCRSLILTLSPSLRLNIVIMFSILACRIASLFNKIFREFSMLTITCPFVQTKQCQFNFWMAWIPVLLVWVWAEGFREQVNVFENWLHKQVIPIVLLMRQRGFDEVTCIISFKVSVRFTQPRQKTGGKGNHTTRASLSGS
jgi:hypothetical protein